MLKNDDFEITFETIGLFSSRDVWIHPEIAVPTYEIIYVVEGVVHIEEDGAQYSLKENSLIILDPNIIHRGFKKSYGPTRFYWMHFYLNRFNDKLNLPKVLENFSGAHLFKELLHYSMMPNRSDNLSDAVCIHILTSLVQQCNKTSSKLADEIYEWARINVSAKLTVKMIADHFGYNPEHISRLILKEHGVRLKSLIDSFVILKIKDLLCNTNYFIKEIASLLSFSDATACNNFFKYHEKVTPSHYRNLYSKMHMNKK